MKKWSRYDDDDQPINKPVISSFRDDRPARTRRGMLRRVVMWRWHVDLSSGVEIHWNFLMVPSSPFIIFSLNTGKRRQRTSSLLSEHYRRDVAKERVRSGLPIAQVNLSRNILHLLNWEWILWSSSLIMFFISAIRMCACVFACASLPTLGWLISVLSFDVRGE